VRVLVVSTDDRRGQESTFATVRAEGDGPPSYRMLSDPGAAVIRRYGILDPGGFRGEDIAHPATFVVDTAGVVRWKVVETDYRLRPRTDDVVAALEAVLRGETPPPAAPSAVAPLRSGG
jgi:peroxiredoxin